MVSDEPKMGEFRFHLVAGLLAAGKKQEAKTKLNTALKLNSDLRKRPDVQRVLTQLTKG